MKKVVVSKLPKTWIFDLDGTIVKHNGYKIDGVDTLLPGVKELMSNIGAEDKVIIISARKSLYKEETLEFLKKNEIKYDLIMFDMPIGERIVINDEKPEGLQTAVAVNISRDKIDDVEIVIDDCL